VAEKDIKLDENSIKMLDDWCLQNAERVWINNKGPLAARSEGGADVSKALTLLPTDLVTPQFRGVLTK
jgi:hypothetical protein